MNINIKAKLKAYTKGIIPVNISQLNNDLDFISDVEQDGVFARKTGEWININDALVRTRILIPEDSGLNLEQDGYDYTLSVRKQDILQKDLPNVLENDTVYYVLDLTADEYINAGTAFSNGNNEYVIESDFNSLMNGGDASSQANIFIKPLNSQGVYNG